MISRLQLTDEKVATLQHNAMSQALLDILSQAKKLEEELVKIEEKHSIEQARHCFKHV